MSDGDKDQFEALTTKLHWLSGRPRNTPLQEGVDSEKDINALIDTNYAVLWGRERSIRTHRGLAFYLQGPEEEKKCLLRRLYNIFWTSDVLPIFITIPQGHVSCDQLTRMVLLTIIQQTFSFLFRDPDILSQDFDWDSQSTSFSKRMHAQFSSKYPEILQTHETHFRSLTSLFQKTIDGLGYLLGSKNRLTFVFHTCLIELKVLFQTQGRQLTLLIDQYEHLNIDKYESDSQWLTGSTIVYGLYKMNTISMLISGDDETYFKYFRDGFDRCRFLGAYEVKKYFPGFMKGNQTEEDDIQ